MYKMIALDLDGTLNNDEKKITEKTRGTALGPAYGVTVVLASSRQAPGLGRGAGPRPQGLSRPAALV